MRNAGKACRDGSADFETGLAWRPDGGLLPRLVFAGLGAEIVPGKSLCCGRRFEQLFLRLGIDQRISSRIVSYGSQSQAEVSFRILVDEERAKRGIGHIGPPANKKLERSAGLSGASMAMKQIGRAHV